MYIYINNKLYFIYFFIYFNILIYLYDRVLILDIYLIYRTFAPFYSNIYIGFNSCSALVYYIFVAKFVLCKNILLSPYFTCIEMLTCNWITDTYISMYVCKYPYACILSHPFTNYNQPRFMT